ncbi:uncharacterized protein JCM15063_005601 [Sporobolomyces koalae]|uniref:uncharacterized protein n=1 Tax=Sporobolomyces koalae TaxID=500713 RepID=UPI003182A245
MASADQAEPPVLAQSSSGPESASAPSRSPVLASKPVGLPAKSVDTPAGPRSNPDREEGEEEEVDPPPPIKRNPVRPPAGPVPPGSAPRRRGRSPSFDRFDRSPPYARRYDGPYDDRRGPPGGGGPPPGRGRMVSRSPPTPDRNFRSRSRSFSRSPPPAYRRGIRPGGYRGGGGGYPGRRPISRSPPPFARRPVSRSRSPPPRRYDPRPLSPDFRRRSRSPPPRGYIRPRDRSFSRSPPRRRFDSLSPPPPRGFRRGRSPTRSPPPPHVPFSARRLPGEDDDDPATRRMRNFSRSPSIVSTGSRRMPPRRRRSPSPLPLSRRRSPTPRRRSISPRPRRGSFSPGPPRAFRRRSSTPPPPRRRSPSPPPRRRSLSRSRSPPPGAKRARGESSALGPSSSRLPPTALDASIPTGPRNRGPSSAASTNVRSLPESRAGAPTAPSRPGFQKIGPVSTSTSTSTSRVPTGPSASSSSVPTGPKAWRSIQPGTEAAPSNTSFSTSRSPAPPLLESTSSRGVTSAPASRGASPGPPPPPPPSSSALPPPSAPPASQATSSGPDISASVQSSLSAAALAKEREARQAEIELKRRTMILARYLPRSVGGMLVTVHGVTNAMMQSPGFEFGQEIQQARLARIRSNELDDHIAKLLITRKYDYDLRAARHDANVAKERTKLANGERPHDWQIGGVAAGGGSGY